MIKSYFLGPLIPPRQRNSRKNTIPPGGFHQMGQHVIIQPSNMYLKYSQSYNPNKRKSAVRSGERTADSPFWWDYFFRFLYRTRIESPRRCAFGKGWFILQNSIEVLIKSGGTPQVQVPPRPPERQAKDRLFFCRSILTKTDA